jgi:hypothetical protein
MGESDFPTVFSRPSFCWMGLPAESVFRFRYASLSGFPLLWLYNRIPCPDSGHDKDLTSSCRFSPHMPRPRTPAAPRKSYHTDFSVLASVTLKTSPTAFMLISMLTGSFRNVRIPCGLCGSLCTLRKSSFVDVGRSRNRLPRSAGCATLDTGGWLDLAGSRPLNPPDRDFHPERSDKLRLSH